MFNWADFVIVAILLISMFFSLVRGFTREVLSLIVWLLSFGIAILFANKLTPFLANIIEHPMLQFAAGFVILLVAVLVVGGLITHFISHLFKTTGLSAMDHGLGLLFGFIRGIVVILVGLFVVQMISDTTPAWWTTSFLVPKIWFLMQLLQYGLPSSVHQHIRVLA